MSNKQLIHFALDVGEMMLKNGAETYRVEDSINRILSTSNSTTIDSFVTPTGIFASIDGTDNEHFTYIRRIEDRSIHLLRIERANEISRNFCNETLSLSEATANIKALNDLTLYSPMVVLLGISFASGLFATVFGGTVEDALVAFFSGVGLALFQMLASNKGITKFFIDLTGGFIITTISILLFYFVGLGDHIDIILTSSIMPLVPGVAITNAIRDTLHGHLVTGSTRILDAFIVAASIATGVGIALSLFDQIIGGIIL